MIKLKQIKKCEVCGSSNLLPVLNLGQHPLCDDLIPIGNKIENQKFPINIVFCEKCITAHQKFQVPKIDLFPKNYHYRSRFTADVIRGMEGLVNSIETKKLSLKENVVLDIGCNDGSLLDKFKQRGATTIGVEPTGAYADAEGRNHIIFNDFFTEKTAKKILKNYPQIDVITFTNVFAHIEDLRGLLKALSALINEGTIIVIENHYLGAILNHNQFDTFYHEHPRTYSQTSFEFIAKKLGLNILKVQYVSRYGGNIRVFIGKGKSIETAKKKEKDFLFKFKIMEKKLNEWIINTKKFILNYVKLNGKIKAKAFPGRAAILIKLLDINENHISAVYEIKGSIKVGHYVPGTRIPIYPEKELFSKENQTDPILNLAWHIAPEVKENLKVNGYKGKVINIKDMI